MRRRRHHQNERRGIPDGSLGTTMWSNRRMIRTSRLLMSIAGIDLMAKCRFGFFINGTPSKSAHTHLFFDSTDRTIPKIPLWLPRVRILNDWRVRQTSLPSKSRWSPTPNNSRLADACQACRGRAVATFLAAKLRPLPMCRWTGGALNFTVCPFGCVFTGGGDENKNRIWLSRP